MFCSRRNRESQHPSSPGGHPLSATPGLRSAHFRRRLSRRRPGPGHSGHRHLGFPDLRFGCKRGPQLGSAGHGARRVRQPAPLPPRRATDLLHGHRLGRPGRYLAVRPPCTLHTKRHPVRTGERVLGNGSSLPEPILRDQSGGRFHPAVVELQLHGGQPGVGPRGHPTRGLPRLAERRHAWPCSSWGPPPLSRSPPCGRARPRSWPRTSGDRSIGRPVPARLPSFSGRNPGVGHIAEYDVATGENTATCPLLEGNEFFTWGPDGVLLMGHGSKLFRWILGSSDSWLEVADFGPLGINGITRLAVSPEGGWIAVVAADPGATAPVGG